MTKRKILILIQVSFFLILGCSNRWKWINTLPEPWTLSEDEVTELLPEFQKRFPDFQDRLKAFAIWRIGTPYEIFKLGEEVEPDTDPIIRLDVSDCTVHVLTSLAFSQSNTWEEARERMVEIHYKPDPEGNIIPSYVTRWHYTSDRITANPYTVDITKSLLRPNDLATVNIILNQKEDGNELLDLGWKREVSLKYIPNNKINESLLKKIPVVCGVAFIRKSFFSKGIIVAHEGMIIDRKNLIHASSVTNKTELIDFLTYYFPEGGSVFNGIMIYKFVPIEN